MDGTLEVSGTFNKGEPLCGMETRYLPQFGNAKLGLRFHALLESWARAPVDLRLEVAGGTDWSRAPTESVADF
jgi:hypothetical protein